MDHRIGITDSRSQFAFRATTKELHSTLQKRYPSQNLRQTIWSSVSLLHVRNQTLKLESYSRAVDQVDQVEMSGMYLVIKAQIDPRPV